MKNSLFDFINKKGILIPWSEKKEKFIEQYGEIKAEDLISKNWNELEKQAFRFIIDLASYY